MAASNLLEKLDPALLRPGPLRPPGLRLAARRRRARARSCEVHTRNKPLREDVDLDVVAQQTSGLTGADLANICNEAAIFCARRKGHAISREDFDDALERVIAGVQSSTTLNDARARASSPTTRPATRSAASCSTTPSACTRSRSSRAARRSAT